MRRTRALTSVLVASGLAIAQQVCAPAKSAVAPIEPRTVVSEAKSAALRIKDDFQRGQVLDEVGALKAKTGDLNAAVETVNLAYPHTTSTLTAIAAQLVDSKDSEVRSVTARLKGGGSSTIYTFLAEHQAERGDFDRAFHTTEQIQAHELRRHALESIAKQQAANGDYRGARKTVAQATAAYDGGRSAADDAETVIIEGQVSGGNLQAARAEIAALKSPEARSIVLVSGAGTLQEKGDKANAIEWLAEGLQHIPVGATGDFLRYLAIPVEVKLGQEERAMQAARNFSADLQVKGYTAVAVACAEMMDLTCVNAALDRMRVVRGVGREEVSEFVKKLMILNVTAALVDSGDFEDALRWLHVVEAKLDDAGTIPTELEIQLQHVLIAAKQNHFDEARSVALGMRPDSIAETQRGTALRMVASIQTKTDGVASSHPWALALADPEDRAFALIGIAQAQLGNEAVKLPYSAIQVH